MRGCYISIYINGIFIVWRTLEKTNIVIYSCQYHDDCRALVWFNVVSGRYFTMVAYCRSDRAGLMVLLLWIVICDGYRLYWVFKPPMQQVFFILLLRSDASHLTNRIEIQYGVGIQMCFPLFQKRGFYQSHNEIRDQH